MDNLIDITGGFFTEVVKKGIPCKTMNELQAHIYQNSKAVRLNELPPTSLAIKAHNHIESTVCHISDDIPSFLTFSLKY